MAMRICWAFLELILAALFFYTGNGLVLAVGISLILLPLAALPINLSVRKKLRITLYVPPNLRKHVSGEIILEVENPTWLPVLRMQCVLEAENRLNGLKKTAQIICFSMPKSNKRVALEIGDGYCGRIKLQVNQIRLYDCLGLIGVRCRREEHRSLTVQPDTFVQNLYLNSPAGVRNDSEVYSPDRPGEDMTEVFQIREYVEGDSLRQIHWKLTGKLDRLIVKEPSLPIIRSVLVFWERTVSSGDPVQTDAQAEVLITLCRSLVEQSVQFTVGWNDPESRRCNLQQITNMDEMVGLIPKLLSVRGKADGISGAELLVQALGDRSFSRTVYIGETEQPMLGGHPQLGCVTSLLISGDGSGNVDPVSYAQQLAELVL